MVTHVICDNPDNPGVSEAQELFEKPVMTVSSYAYIVLFYSPALAFIVAKA